MNTDKNNTQLPQSSVSVSAFLTGKAKQDFEKGVIPLIREIEKTPITDEKRCLDWIYDTNDLIQIAHYVMWFDSVNLQITTEAIQGGEFRCFVLKDKFHHHWIDDRFENRQKAIISAIKKANELYNENVVEAEH